MSEGSGQRTYYWKKSSSFRAKRAISLPLRFKRKAAVAPRRPGMTNNELCGRSSQLRVIITHTMATQKAMLTEFAWDPRYQVSSIANVLTPALLLYPEILAANIGRTVELLGSNPDRWCAHIKTAKLGYTLRMLVARGIRKFKCATTLELLVACQCGAADVLLAYPSVGANALRVREIATQFQQVRISVLAENEEQLQQWHGGSVGIFLDINPRMDRTGI